MNVNRTAVETDDVENRLSYLGAQPSAGFDKTADYEHQNSYANAQVAASTLHAIVQIAKTDKWD